MRPRSSGCGDREPLSGPGRAAPLLARSRPYLPAALGEEDRVLQHHLEAAHRFPTALRPQLGLPTRHHPGGELQRRGGGAVGAGPGRAASPAAPPAPPLPAEPSCPAGTGTPWRRHPVLRRDGEPGTADGRREKPAGGACRAADAARSALTAGGASPLEPDRTTLPSRGSPSTRHAGAHRGSGSRLLPRA